MLKRILAALDGTAGAIAVTGAAFAADLTQPPPPPPPVPIFTWTGLYIGIQVGGVWARDSATLVNPGSGPGVQNVNGVLIPFPIPAVNFPFTVNESGVIGGGHIGYDVQINQWVLGVEGRSTARA
jgi:outer membrane immunogenic protein